MGRMVDAVTHERWARWRIGLAWGLLVLNVLPYYSTTWDGQPLFLPIPSAVGKLIAQGALPAALFVALTVNRRLVIRPNAFLCLLFLMLLEALLTLIRHEYLYENLFGTAFRTARLAGFVATLWLLTPWWGRRDLLLVRCQIAVMSVVLGTIVLGLFCSPSLALTEGRLSGVLWPIPPTQVAHYAAETIGLMALLWLCGRIRGRTALVFVVAGAAILLLTHTRTALLAMVIGLVVGGLSLFAAKSRVRKAFLACVVVGGGAALTLSGVITHWLARGQDSQQLTGLTGRATVWQLVETLPRNRFEVLFGFGLSNNSFNGLAIDSNWLATYNDQGLFGIALCASLIIFLFVLAYFRPRGVHRAMALFLVTYCLVASYTETGLSQPSSYLIDMALAASLLMMPLAAKRSGPALPPLLERPRQLPMVIGGGSG
jgi:O-Antigen ligase